MSRRTHRQPLPRPFLKWAGGKTQLLEELRQQVLRAGRFGRYHEPFVGGGALFFDLFRSGRLGRSKAYLSDNNDSLIQAYLGVQQNPVQVIALLRAHEQAHNHDYFYQMRAHIPSDPVARAARIIYLNKTCYNGLFRENSRGEFNVPIGRYKSPVVCDEKNLRAVAEALKKAKIEQRPFTKVLNHARQGDFVYFDPPYHPVSKTASFTAYDKAGFGESQQRDLARVFTELDRRGVKVLLSNSMTDFVRELYADFSLSTVMAKRSVNSRADRRGAVAEALVRNF